MLILSNVGVAVLAFVATNLDNLLLLLMFFADRRFTARQVVLGNSLAGLILIFAGLACGLAAYTLPTLYVSWLGIVPLTVGCWQLARLIRPRVAREKELTRGGHWNTLAVVSVCLAHGSDNVVVYGSLFAVSSPGACLISALVFGAMIAVFNRAGRGLVQHPVAGKFLRRIAPITTPLVLLGFGLWILFKGVIH